MLLSLALAIAVSAPAHAVVVDRLEASVNSALILKSDVEKFRRTVGLRQQLDPLFAGSAIAAKGDKAPESEVVDFLINERLIMQQFPVTDPEVEQDINSIQASNRIDRSSLKHALEGQGYSFDDYFELIRMSSAKRALIERDIRTKVTISDDDVKNYYYNKVNKESSAPLSYRVKIITVTPGNYKTPSAAKEVADRALKEIRGGEAFEDVAKRISDDSSAEHGGDLGQLTEDQMSGPISKELKKMQIGQVSEVLGAPNNKFFILKLTDVASSDTERFTKVKEDLRQQLAAGEYQHQIALWLDRQRQTAFIHRAGEPSVK